MRNAAKGLAIIALGVAAVLVGLVVAFDPPLSPSCEAAPPLGGGRVATVPLDGVPTSAQPPPSTVSLLGRAALALRQAQYLVFQRHVQEKLPAARQPRDVPWPDIAILTIYETAGADLEGAHLAERINEAMDANFEELTATCARTWPPLATNQLQSVDVRVVLDVETVAGGAAIRDVEWHESTAWDKNLEECVVNQLRKAGAGMLALETEAGFRRRVLTGFRWLSPQRKKDIESGALVLPATVPGLPEEEQEALQAQGATAPR